MRRALALGVAVLLGGCTMNTAHLQDAPHAVAVATPDVTRSMIYLARTDRGVVVVDLGWSGAASTLRYGLRRLGATPDDVVAVFLTHSHRDHVFGWSHLPGARFHLAAAEMPHFLGEAGHRDLPSRVAAALFPGLYPRADEVEVRGFATDTAFVFGADTVRAFTVPGHTGGSAAYLYRDVLFIGDSIHFSLLRGFVGAKRIFTADPAGNRTSLASLWGRAAPFAPEWVCTSHSKCVRFEALRAKLDPRLRVPLRPHPPSRGE